MARKRYKPEEIVAKLRQFAKAMKRTAGALRQKAQSWAAVRPSPLS